MRRRRYLALTGGLSLSLSGCTESAQTDPGNSEGSEGSDDSDVEVLSDADVAVVDIDYEGHWAGSVGNAGSLRTVEGEGSEAIDVPIDDTENGQLLLQMDNGQDGRTVRASIEKADDGTGTLTVRISIEGDVVSEGSTTEGSDRVDLSVRVLRPGESDAEEPDNESTEPDETDPDSEPEPPNENATDETDELEDDTATDDDGENAGAPPESDGEPDDDAGSTGPDAGDGTEGDTGSADEPDESDEPEGDDAADTEDSDEDNGSDTDSVGDPEEREPTSEGTPDDSTTEDAQDDD